VLKAGFIGAIIGFIYITSLNLLSPLCTLCLTPLLGLGVGYLTGWFDKPQSGQDSLSRGMMAGMITGFAVVCGQMVAAVTNIIILSNLDEWPKLMTEWGLSPTIPNEAEYWQMMVGLNGFCGLLNLGVIISLSALGSLLWFYRNNKKNEVRNSS
jgi:hypothetical protein